MDNYATSFRKALLLLVSCLIGLFYSAQALEISDITLPLTRDAADRTLSKDYAYSMLADGSVRRVWDLNDKQIFIDFDTNTNEAVLVAIVYKRPVDKKVGIADAHTLAKGMYADNATWDAAKDKTARQQISDTFGLNNARRKKLNNKAMLFYEMNDKGSRITRVSYFSLMPSTNRWELAEMRPDDEANALGTSWGKEHIEGTYRDEARRQAIPLSSEEGTPSTETSTDSAAATTTAAADTAATPAKPVSIATTTTTKPNKPARPAATTKPTAPKAADDETFEGMGTQTMRNQERKTAMGTRKHGDGTSGPKISAARQSSGEKLLPGMTVKKVVHEGQESKKTTVSTLPPPPTWLKAVGIENPTWAHYIGGGIILLILIAFILRSIAKAGAKAERKKQFAQVIGQGQPAGRRISRR